MTRRSNLGTVVLSSLIVVCAAQFSVAQVDWTYQYPVVPPGDPGSWDEGHHEVASVVFDGTTYHMYLLGGPGENPLDNSWSVGHWTSNDVTGPWVPDPCNPVLEPGSPGEWDSFGVLAPAVLYDGAEFRMWYGATDTYHGLLYGGYATNPDGRCDWEKHEDYPLEGLDPGVPGAWDENGPAPNTVLFDGVSYRMWYGTGSGIWDGSWAIGHATSPDGLVWTKDPDPVLVPTVVWEGDKVYFPTVFRNGGGYSMLYSGLVMSPIAMNIGYAASGDGLEWGKWPTNAVLTPLPGCWGVSAIAELVQGDTVHGWVFHCDDVYYVTSPFEVVFFDTFETGDTSVWGAVVP